MPLASRFPLDDSPALIEASPGFFRFQTPMVDLDPPEDGAFEAAQWEIVEDRGVWSAVRFSFECDEDGNPEERPDPDGTQARDLPSLEAALLFMTQTEAREHDEAFMTDDEREAARLARGD